jgi:hypothetical protein
VITALSGRGEVIPRYYAQPGLAQSDNYEVDQLVFGPGGDFEAEQDNNEDVQPQHHLNDVKIIYHDNAAKGADLFSFEDYCGIPEDTPVVNAPLDEQPWRPFRTLTDFEFAEIALDAHMNRRQIDAMIKLVIKIVNTPDSFTLSSEKDLSNVWEYARSTRTTGVSNTILGFQTSKLIPSCSFPKKKFRWSTKMKN